MSCVIHTEKKWQEVEVLEEMFDTVKFSKGESGFYSLFISNKHEGNNIDEVVYFDGKIRQFSMVRILKYFGDTKAKEEDFVNVAKFGYKIDFTDKNMPTQEQLEDAYVHFTGLLIDGEPLDKNYIYKGFKIAHALDEGYGFIAEAMSDFELYGSFGTNVNLVYAYHGDSSFLTVNFYLGRLAREGNVDVEFSVANASVMARVRKNANVEEKSLDAKEIVVKVAVDVMSHNWDRVQAGGEELTQDDVVNLAKNMGSAAKFKKAIVGRVTTANGGGSICAVRGMGGFQEYRLDKITFRLDAYKTLYPLLREELEDTGLFNTYSDDALMDVDMYVILFDSKKHDVYKMVWEYYRHSGLVMSVKTDENFTLSEDLKEQKRKIMGGANLFDLM